jgi:sec-independent protein translocase protein TatB
LFALILETLSTTELLFILVIALIFFGPRKLPQLARSIGKSVAEFRKASEDFKRTWEREVALETSRIESAAHSMLDMDSDLAPAQNPAAEAMVEPPDPELVVPRNGSTPTTSEQTVSASDSDLEKNATANSQKQDWS